MRRRQGIITSQGSREVTLQWAAAFSDEPYCALCRSTGFGGGASRSREAAGEGRRNHQRGTGQISAKTGESVVTRPRRRTRRLQCDVSGATLTEIEGPGTSSGAYGRGGGGTGGRAGGRDRARDERKEVCPPVSGGGDGRGAVTLPTRPPPALQRFFYRLGSFHFPPSPSAVFFPVANPLGGGASRSREAAGEGRRNHQRGTGQISAKTGESVVTRPRRRTRRLQSFFLQTSCAENVGFLDCIFD